MSTTDADGDEERARTHYLGCAHEGHRRALVDLMREVRALERARWHRILFIWARQSQRWYEAARSLEMAARCGTNYARERERQAAECLHRWDTLSEVADVLEANNDSPCELDPDLAALFLNEEISLSKGEPAKSVVEGSHPSEKARMAQKLWAARAVACSGCGSLVSPEAVGHLTCSAGGYCGPRSAPDPSPEQQENWERRFDAGERLCVGCGKATADTYGGLCATCDVAADPETYQERITREVVQAQGGCGVVDHERSMVCIQAKGHKTPCFDDVDQVQPITTEPGRGSFSKWLRSPAAAAVVWEASPGRAVDRDDVDRICAALAESADVYWSETARAPAPARWRVGRTLGRTLYRDERYVGTVDTRELAAELVNAANGADQQLQDIALAAERYLEANRNYDPDDTVDSTIDCMVRLRRLGQLLDAWRGKDEPVERPTDEKRAAEGEKNQ